MFGSGYNSYGVNVHGCLFSRRMSSQSWLMHSGILAGICLYTMAYILGCGSILVKKEWPLASPYIPWVEPSSSHANCGRNCPPTHPCDRQGGRQRQYHTPFWDTLTEYKIHVQFLFHKAAQEFCEINPK